MSPNKGSIFTAQAVGFVRQERMACVTEAKLIHIESLINQAKRYENIRSEWGFLEKLHSNSIAVSITVALTVGGLSADKSALISPVGWFLFVLVFCLALITTFICSKFQKSLQKTKSQILAGPLDELSALIEEARKTLDHAEEAELPPQQVPSKNSEGPSLTWGNLLDAMSDKQGK